MMMSVRVHLILAVFAAQALSACIDAPIESSTTQAIADNNKLAGNKLAGNKLAGNKLAGNKLAANKFAINKPSGNDLLATADGREVLEYLVGCAMPENIVLVGENAGVTYTFHGDIGLTPRWLDRSLHNDEKGWISACMIARVNKYGVSVPVSLRGENDALAVTDSEAVTYTAQEAAFYGDIFTPGNQPIVWIACRGEAQAAGEHGQLVDRDCAEPDPAHPGLTMCGFTYAGDCADWQLPHNSYACKKFQDLDEDDDHDCGSNHNNNGNNNNHGNGHHNDDDGGYYKECHDEPGNGHWNGATRYDQVITVYVAP
jgi:hypothetical protein